MTQVLPTRTSYFLRSPKQSMIDIKNCLFGTLSILNNIKQRAIRTNHKTKFRRCLNIPSPLRSALKPGHRPINNIWDKPSTLQKRRILYSSTFWIVFPLISWTIYFSFGFQWNFVFPLTVITQTLLFRPLEREDGFSKNNWSFALQEMSTVWSWHSNWS